MRNPSAIPAGTSAEVWKRQIAAIAARTTAENMADWESLNKAYLIRWAKLLGVEDDLRELLAVAGRD